MLTLNPPLPLHAQLDRQTHVNALGLGIEHEPLAKRISPYLKAIFTGQVVNPTEGRAATHWVHRAVAAPAVYEDMAASAEIEGVDELAEAQAVAKRMEAWTDEVRAGRYTNPEGVAYTGILHLGIGGSDLGPRLLDQVFERLYLRNTAACPLRTLHFAANVDYHEMDWALQGLDPKTTLVIIASKSFSTRETLLNASHALRWLRTAGEQFAQAALVGVTCKPLKAEEMGIPSDRIFPFSENVGGRYSLWSPVSVAIRLMYGNEVFNDFLAGGALADHHALTAPLANNLPAQLAYCDLVNLRMGVDALMLSPYDSRLGLLVPYLQQLWMESLGKGVDLDGKRLTTSPCPVLWGDVGTNGQHAFFQMLHQGPQACAVELLGIQTPQHTEKETHQILMSHFLAQAEAMSVGRFNSDAERNSAALAHKTCPGKRPVTSLVLNALTPYNLGLLLATWENRTAALAALQHINPFDQWGVELGKVIAQGLEEPLIQGTGTVTDAVTKDLLQLLQTQ